MREDAPSRAELRPTELRDPAAGLPVLLLDADGLGQGQPADLLGRLAARGDLRHSPGRPAQVRGRRASAADLLRQPLELRPRLGGVARARPVEPQDNAEGPGHPEGRRSSHHQPADGVHHVRGRGQPADDQPLGEDGLVDHLQVVLRPLDRASQPARLHLRRPCMNQRSSPLMISRPLLAGPQGAGAQVRRHRPGRHPGLGRPLRRECGRGSRGIRGWCPRGRLGWPYGLFCLCI